MKLFQFVTDQFSHFVFKTGVQLAIKASFGFEKSLASDQMQDISNPTPTYTENSVIVGVPVPSIDFEANTVEPRFNEPLFNEVLNIMDDTLRPGQCYNKLYGIQPQYNEPWYNKFFDITDIIRNPKRKIYLDITNYSVYTWQNINAAQISDQQSTNL